MKKLLIILCMCKLLFGVTRYVSSIDGDNGNDGLSPETPKLTLSGSGVQSGDSLLLKRGSIFRGAWTPPVGSEGDLTFIGDYGEGDKVRITGAELISAIPVLNDNNIYAFGDIVKAYKIWLDGTLAVNGSDSVNLNNHEWYHNTTLDTLWIRFDEGYADQIIETVTATQTIRNPSYTKFENINFRMGNSFIVRITSASSNVIFSNCDFAEASCNISITSGTDIYFNSCTFDTNYGPKASMLLAAGSSVNFNFCLFANNTFGAIRATGGSHTINNCNFNRFRTKAIASTSADTIKVSNTIIHGSYPYPSSLVSASSGPILIDNSVVMFGGIGGGSYVEGNVVITNAKKYDPQFVKTANKGFLSLTEDDRNNGAEFKKIADYAKSVNNNFSLSWCVSEGYLLSSIDSGLIKAIANSGHDITSHSMSHTYLYPDMGLFTVEYTGLAPACTVIIRNDSIITLTGGVDDRVVGIEFDYDKSIVWLEDSFSIFDNYILNRIAAIHSRQMVFVAADDTLLDVKNNPDSILLNRDKFYAWEFDSSKAFLERVTGDYVLEYTYPGNMTDSSQIPFLRDAGYIGARTTTPLSITMRDTFPLYRLPIQFNAANGYSILRLDNSTNSAANSTDFTDVNLTYSETEQIEYKGCAVLDGTAYLYREDSTFHYWSGDYIVGIWIKPTVLNSKNTILYTGVNADSCLTVYIDNNGAIHYQQKRNGVAVVDLVSENGVISINEWTRLVFRQTIDTISVFTGTDVPATNRVIYAAAYTPDNYNNITYLGTDFSSGSGADFFTGYFDKVDITFDVWFKTISCADQIAAQGCFATSLTHGDYLGPRDNYKCIIDAMGQYSGRCNLIGLTPALKILRENGTFINEDSLYIKWDQIDSSDYRLWSTSKISGDADTNVLSGIPNLINLSGDTITDNSGDMVVTTVNIGAYGTLAADQPPEITAQPENDTVRYSGDAQFTVTASGSDPKSYLWYQNGDSVGNSNTLTISSVTMEMDGYEYFVIIANEFGADTSDTVVLSVYWPTFTIDTNIVGSGTLQLNPAGLEQDSGTTVTFTGNADEGYVGDTSFNITLLQDTSVTVTFLQHPVIDSIRNNPEYYGERISIYGSGFLSSQGIGFIVIEGDTLSDVEMWTDTHIIDTIPADMERGHKELQINNNNNLIWSAEESLRVLRPYVR